MMRLLGKARRLPLAPAPNKKAPMLAAMPKQTVETSQGTYCYCRERKTSVSQSTIHVRKANMDN